MISIKKIIESDPSGVKAGIDCIYETGFKEEQRKLEERMAKTLKGVFYSTLKNFR